MKVTLEFKIPKEQTEFNFAVNGAIYYGAISEIRHLVLEKLSEDSGTTYADMKESLKEILGLCEVLNG